jgi:hypothetical protein
MNKADHGTLGVNDTWGGQLDRSHMQPTVFDVPVRVYGSNSDDSPFYKEALILFANAEGGVLLLNMPVCDGQLLLITNMATEKDHTCRVKHSFNRGTGKIEVGFEFSCPTFEF